MIEPLRAGPGRHSLPAAHPDGGPRAVAHGLRVEAAEEFARALTCALRRCQVETCGHLERVGRYAGELGRALGWTGSALEDLRWAAALHDVGKLGVPRTILLKPGRLTRREFELVQRHSEIGAALLGIFDLPRCRLAAEIALCHHERWDGRGYPRGLAGAEIPVAARLVAVLDVYDALIHPRAYRPALCRPWALAVMEEGRGKQFDPRVLDVFLGLEPRL